MVIVVLFVSFYHAKFLCLLLEFGFPPICWHKKRGCSSLLGSEPGHSLEEAIFRNSYYYHLN